MQYKVTSRVTCWISAYSRPMTILGWQSNLLDLCLQQTHDDTRMTVLSMKALVLPNATILIDNKSHNRHQLIYSYSHRTWECYVMCHGRHNHPCLLKLRSFHWQWVLPCPLYWWSNYWQAVALAIHEANCILKVVALANTSKSNLNNFRWIGTVVGLIFVSAVLWRSLLACMSYRRKKEMKIVSNSKCYLIT